MNEVDRKILGSLRERTMQALESAIDFSRPVALVDVPTHTNAGDLMIYRGMRTYLEMLDADLRYVSDLRRFDAQILRSRMPVGTVLILGGGNLGDLWPVIHLFKERLANELIDYPIVQLPQTAFFAAKENAQSANAAFTKHGNFTLMLRDTASMDRSESYFPGMIPLYVPDTAFGWDVKPESSGREECKCVVLARTDKEAKSQLSDLRPADIGLPNAKVTDWTLSKLDRTIYTLARVPGKLTNGLVEHQRRRLLHPLMEQSHNLATSAILRSAQRTFAGADLIVTDRLHSHILATLMGIPNIVLDNSYGKVKALFDDYTGDFSTGTFAHGMSHVMELVENRKSVQRSGSPETRQ